LRLSIRKFTELVLSLILGLRGIEWATLSQKELLKMRNSQEFTKLPPFKQ